MRECAALGQRAPESAKRGFPWLVALVGLMLLALAGLGSWRWWQNEQACEHAQRLEAAKQRIWDGYVAELRAQPGIVITEAGRRDGKFLVTGLRDPLAVDPELLLRQAGTDPAGVVRALTLGPSGVVRSGMSRYSKSWGVGDIPPSIASGCGVVGRPMITGVAALQILWKELDPNDGRTRITGKECK